MESIENLRRALERKKGERNQLQDTITKGNDKLRLTKRHQRNVVEAQTIILTVAQKTQAELKYHISELVTLALATVFTKDPYEFKAEFEQRRNQTEVDLLFVRNGIAQSPLESSGGGAAYVAAYALRVALWRLQRPRSRAVFLLDEPFKGLKGQEANLNVLQGARRLSHQFELQNIMVSDERIPREDTIENADRVFEVTIEDGVSMVTSE